MTLMVRSDEGVRGCRKKKLLLPIRHTQRGVQVGEGRQGEGRHVEEENEEEEEEEQKTGDTKNYTKINRRAGGEILASGNIQLRWGEIMRRENFVGTQSEGRKGHHKHTQ